MSPFRAFSFALCLEGLVLGLSAAPGLSLAQNAAPGGGPSFAAPPQALPPGESAPAPVDPIAGRVKYLHDRLRITPEQEPLWDAVAQALRDNAQGIVPRLRERLRARTSGSALDVLNAYEALGESQLEGLRKLIAAFGALYAGLSDAQKKIADAILREGPLNSMFGGLPELPAPFGSPLSYEFAAPYYYGLLFGRGLGVPVFGRHPRTLLHFHGLVSSGRTAMGGFHR